MDYKGLYYKFIAIWQNQELDSDIYTEMHHILPRHSGGGDEKENLVRLTYRQHTFSHRLRWKAFQHPSDFAAWTLMSATSNDSKFVLCQMAGRIGGAKNRESGHISNIGKTYGPQTGRSHVESGHLDRIRLLIDKEGQRERARKLGLANKENGVLEKALKAAWEANQVNNFSEERAEFMRALNKEFYSYDHMLAMSARSVEDSKIKAEKRWQSIIDNAERNDEYIGNPTSRTRFIYVSPEGIEFTSSAKAAKYYGGEMNKHDADNWCKRGHFGWYKKEFVDSING